MSPIATFSGFIGFWMILDWTSYAHSA